MAAENPDYVEFTQNVFVGLPAIGSSVQYGFELVGSAGECIMFLHEDSDIDLMLNVPDVVAVSKDLGPISVSSTAGDEVQVLRISTDWVHVGYANLLLDYGQEITHLELDEDYDPDNSRFIRHGPALMMSRNSSLIHKLQVAVEIDLVTAIKCPVWPVEASEWVTRRRQHGWPSQELINNIVQQGCHFVAIAHKQSTNPDTEFRFSFSKAEVQLIHSWQETQKEVYRQLRLVVLTINQQFHKDDRILCSYHMKTLMLWACEEKPTEFWAQDNVLGATQQLMGEIVECLLHKRFPSYFIRDNNLLDLESETNLTDLGKILDTLLYLAGNDDSLKELLYSQSKTLLGFIEAASTTRMDHMKQCRTSLMPLSLVFVALLGKLTVGSPYENVVTRVKLTTREVVRVLLECDLCDLYRGLRAQLQSHRLAGQQKEGCLRVAERYLLKATAAIDRVVKVSCKVDASNDMFDKLPLRGGLSLVTDFFSDMFMVDESSLQEIHQQVISTISNFDNCCTTGDDLETGAESFHKLCCPLKEMLYTRHPKSDLAQCQPDALEKSSHFDWGKIGFPLICRGISWYLSTVYLCNFYYVSNQYCVALKLCDGGILRPDKFNGIEYSVQCAVSELCFSIVISSRWSEIFDVDIQSALIDEQNQQERENSVTEVSLHACPILFLLYIKVRCLIDTGQDYIESYENFLEHSDFCANMGSIGNQTIVGVLCNKITLRNMGLL